jgi:dolichol-phosphate mannosyltransferase
MLHIVTPVYNEGDNFPELYRQVSKIKTPHELIVVYDFDQDTTVSVVKKLQKKDKRLILHKNTKGKGVLGALLNGFDYVKEGPVLVIMADLCDDLSIVDSMYKEYKKGATIVCPSRYMKGGQQLGGPLFKRCLSRVAGVSLHYVRRFPIHDVTNSFRLYDKKFIDSITIESTGGFSVTMEITVKAFRQGKKIVEIPTVWRDRSAGESKFKLREWLPSYLRWYFYALDPRSNR